MLYGAIDNNSICNVDGLGDLSLIPTDLIWQLYKQFGPTACAILARGGLKPLIPANTYCTALYGPPAKGTRWAYDNTGTCISVVTAWPPGPPAPLAPPAPPPPAPPRPKSGLPGWLTGNQDTPRDPNDRPTSKDHTECENQCNLRWEQRPGKPGVGPIIGASFDLGRCLTCCDRANTLQAMANCIP